MTKPVIEVFANRDSHGGESFLTTDQLGRLRMSAGLVKMLSAQEQAIKLYVGYDVANRRIALGKPDIVKPTDAKPVTFDRTRHYGNVRKFLDKYQIPTERVRFVYDGNYEGWMMFRQEEYDAPDGRGQ